MVREWYGSQSKLLYTRYSTPYLVNKLPKKGYKSITVTESLFEWLRRTAKVENLSIPGLIREKLARALTVKDIMFIDIAGVNFDFEMEMNKTGSTIEEVARSPVSIGFNITGKGSETSSLTFVDAERIKLFSDRVKRMAKFRLTISEIIADANTKEDN